MANWTRDLLILPLMVGFVIAAFIFGLPKIFGDKLELSYEIDRPTAVLDAPAIRQLQIEVNGIAVSELIAFRVRLWNWETSPSEICLSESFLMPRRPISRS